MSNCPICETEYAEGKPNFCTVCGYPLRDISDILNLTLGYTPNDLEKREERIKQLLRKWWERKKQLEEKLKEKERDLQIDSSDVQNGDETTKLNSSGDIPEGVNSPESKVPYVVRSETNQRENNEDSLQISQILPGFGKPPITVLAVADGMGGHTHGEDASREALRKVSMVLHEQLNIEYTLNSLEMEAEVDAAKLSEILTQALQQANGYIRRLVEANKWKNSGSTIVICTIISNTAVVAFLGDSPMFHYQRKEGTLRKVTQDHTVAGALERGGLITPEMARVHEGRSRLEFYVGCQQLPKELPIDILTIETGDILLLCSDGISGSLAHEEITEIIANNGDNLEATAQQLIDSSLAAEETDNQTLILWSHSGEFCK